jgi:hypothetical protein
VYSNLLAHNSLLMVFTWGDRLRLVQLSRFFVNIWGEPKKKVVPKSTVGEDDGIESFFWDRVSQESALDGEITVRSLDDLAVDGVKVSAFQRCMSPCTDDMPAYKERQFAFRKLHSAARHTY